LYFGGEKLVDGASSLAIRLGISELIVGMTIVAMGTSAPEAFVSVIASLKNEPDIALGNVVGSNIANIGLALALAALIKPVYVRDSFFKREFPFLMIATTMLVFMAFDRGISRLDGIIFLGMMCVFIGYCVFNAKTNVEKIPDEDVSVIKNPVYDYVYITLGLVTLSFGSDLFVKGAIQLATMLGISEFIIGLTVVALGTSLPEIATLVISSWRGKSGIAVGTIVGSNIFNILFVLGIAGTISPFRIETESFMADMWIMLGFALIIAPLLFFDRKIFRWEGMTLLAGYIGYVFYLVYRSTS
ncbi:calcium/sodium antiporter, partial [bacterium]|nr:calcium/sodium antiporter [bacterium]MBU1024979.1 calcium/sodium antiporter [bacterium]